MYRFYPHVSGLGVYLLVRASDKKAVAVGQQAFALTTLLSQARSAEEEDRLVHQLANWGEYAKDAVSVLEG